MLHSLSRRRLSRYLRRVRRALATPFEPVRARARPRDDVPCGIGHGNNGVVERGLEVGPAARNVLAIATSNPSLRCSAPPFVCHTYPAPVSAKRASALSPAA